MSNPVEEEITLAFLKKVSEVYNKPLDSLTPVWETIKSGKKPVVNKVVEVCAHKLASGKNKGQPCGKKLKDGVCSIHPPKPVAEAKPLQPEIVEEEEEVPLVSKDLVVTKEIPVVEEDVPAKDGCPVILSAGSRKGEACGKKIKKGETKCTKHC